MLNFKNEIYKIYKKYIQLTKSCRIAHKPNKNQYYNKHKRTRVDHFTKSLLYKLCQLNRSVGHPERMYKLT